MPAFSAPKIECDVPKYDFGTVIAGDAITHRFVIWNRGDEPLEIVKIKNCCGVETSVDPMIIAPGTNAICTSVFTTKNRSGEQDKQILLVTNDKKHLYYDLRMTGILQMPIEFTPRWVRLDNLLADSPVSEIISATNMLKVAVTLDSVSVAQKELTAEIAETSDRGWKIRLSSTSSLPVGQLNTRVILNFSTGPVEVPVVGTIRPVIQSSPETILFNSSATGEVERQVMLRSGDGRSFDIVSASLENAEGSVATERLVDGKWRIRLSVQPKSIVNGSVLHIRTSLEAQSVLDFPLLLK